VRWIQSFAADGGWLARDEQKMRTTHRFGFL